METTTLQHVVLSTTKESYAAVFCGNKAATVEDVASAYNITGREVRHFLHCGEESTAVHETGDDGSLAMIRWLCLTGYAQAKNKKSL